jgi:hypothetical protein
MTNIKVQEFGSQNINNGEFKIWWMRNFQVLYQKGLRTRRFNAKDKDINSPKNK